ncbi:Disease resistance protein RPS5 [Rhynchospora pubera]|uniref:Disease resistance protein RPS5 n=1 Tax=Rhynchospora pubera TaxID=906938 RepID=A0AAV8F0M5_9POAL|nr:Disease resistance protein RPS5 [Rhynchospora pubera]
MESVKSTITNTIPEFAGTIVEHVFYPFQVDKRIRDLEWATRDLVALKEDVETRIEIAERQNSSRTKQVVEWLNKVETIEKESEEIQENCRKRRRSFWSNYTTSSSAVKKLHEIKNLCDQKTTFEVTMPLPPPLAHEMPVSSTKSSNLESALHDIKDDVYGVIGIWGMGGVGKTHLLKQINNELCRDHAFDVVLFITCSKECSEEKIQNEIIDKLHLDENGSMEQKQRRIYNFLRERKFVLLLDDLWSRIDLNTIGIPYRMKVGICKRKIVLTTRSTEICGQMEVKKKELEWMF